MLLFRIYNTRTPMGHVSSVLVLAEDEKAAIQEVYEKLPNTFIIDRNTQIELYHDRHPEAKAAIIAVTVE